MADADRPGVLRQIHEYFMALTTAGRLILLISVIAVVGLLGLSLVQCTNNMAYDDCVDSRRAEYGIEGGGGVIATLIEEDCRKITG
jgi:hypothetical protein